MAEKDDKEAAEALKKALGEAIKAVRKRKELRQVQIADSGNLSRFENGLQWASPEQLLQISRALDEPIWLLFAQAEGAIDKALWEVLDIFRRSDEEGRELIDHAVRTSKKYHLRATKVPHGPAKGRRGHET